VPEDTEAAVAIKQEDEAISDGDYIEPKDDLGARPKERARTTKIKTEPGTVAPMNTSENTTATRKGRTVAKGRVKNQGMFKSKVPAASTDKKRISAAQNLRPFNFAALPAELRNKV
jgi:hypothetical protein